MSNIKLAMFTKEMEMWNRIEYKAHNEINDLTHEEKDAIISRIIDSMECELFHSTDETLLNMLIDKGII